MKRKPVMRMLLQYNLNTVRIVLFPCFCMLHMARPSAQSQFPCFCMLRMARPSAQSQAYVFNLKESPLYVCSRAHYKGDMELAKLSPMFSPSGFYIRTRTYVAWNENVGGSQSGLKPLFIRDLFFEFCIEYRIGVINRELLRHIFAKHNAK